MSKLFSNENICAYYLTMFSLLSPITHTYTSHSKLVLLLSASVCVISVIVNNINQVSCLKYLLKIGYFLAVIICLDLGIRYNGAMPDILYSFLIFGILPLFFISYIKDYSVFINSYVTLACIGGLIHIADPFTGYVWSGDYMEFGLSSMLPAFSAVIIAVFFLKRRQFIMYVLLFSFFMLLVLGANKSAILTGFVLFILGYVYLNNYLKINFKILTVLIIVLALLYYNLNFIFDGAIFLLDKFNIDSYSLKSAQLMFENNSHYVHSDTNARSYIWNNAWSLFENKYFLGNGFGYYKSKYGAYEHNLFLEILVSWGIVGLFSFCLILFTAIRNYFKSSDMDKKVVVVTFFFLWVIPMQFSTSFWINPFFWSFIAFSFINPKNTLLHF